MLGVPTAYIPHGKADRILGQLGLDGPGIAASIFKVIERVPEMQPSAGLRVEDIAVEQTTIQADAATRG